MIIIGIMCRTGRLEKVLEVLLGEIDKLEEDETLLKTMEKDMTVGHRCSSTPFSSHILFAECSHVLPDDSTSCLKDHGLASVLSQTYWKKQSVAFSSYQQQERKR